MGFCKRTLQSYMFNLDYQNRLHFSKMKIKFSFAFNLLYFCGCKYRALYGLTRFFYHKKREAVIK